MKPVAFVMPEFRREAAVRCLGRSGVMHLRKQTDPVDDGELERTQSAIRILEEIGFDSMDLNSEAKSFELPEVVSQILRKAPERADLASRLLVLKGELDRFTTLGDFDPAAWDDLRHHGLTLRVYRCPEKEFRKVVESTACSVIHRTKSERWLAVISREEDVIPGLIEVPIPEQSLSELRSEVAIIKSQILDLDQSLCTLSYRLDDLQHETKRLRQQQKFLAALATVHSDSPLAYIEGYCPEPKLAELRRVAQSEGCALIERDIGPFDDPPTLLRNSNWIDSTQSVYQLINSLPGYRETDVSLWFLVFLTVFFAILIGDAGYGLFILLGVGLARHYDHLPTPAFRLLNIFGAATVAWGAVTGNWFGIESLAQAPLLNRLVIPGLNAFMSASQETVILICFLIGASHLSVAHLLIAFRQRHSLSALCQIGWVSIVWGAFFVVRLLVLEIAIPEITYALLISGVVLAVSFAEPQRNILKGIGIGLGRLPLKLMNCFADVISYIRLFAVGMATLAVAASFNEIAASIGFSNPGRILLAILVILLGHGVNIAMAALSVVVHGVRLNMLEFSGHAGLEWSGSEYQPFHLIEPDNL